MASLMRKDGTLTIYVIKHVVKQSDISKDSPLWENSGNCSQFPRRNRKLELYKPIQAAGEIWQEYGIAGTRHQVEANDIAMDMALNFPEYKFAVAEVQLAQRTIIKQSFRYVNPPVEAVNV